VQRCAPFGALRFGLCRERLAAAAGRLGVRIPDLEARAVEAVDEIDVSAHQVRRTELVDEEVDVVELADSTFEETRDPLNPARGILLALLLSVPFWIAVVYWLIW